MNHAVIQKHYAISPILSKSPCYESLLSRIVSRLKTILSNHHSKLKARVQHRSFIDANLLDEVMGPEIRRALR